MSRQRFQSRTARSLVWLAVAELTGCGNRTAAPAEVRPTGPLARPESVRVEGSLGDLAQLAGALPTALAAAAPSDAVALLEGACVLPAGLRERIAGDARVVYVLLRTARESEPSFAVAVPVRVDEGQAPLGAGVALNDADGAPAGGRWIGAAESADRAAGSADRAAGSADRAAGGAEGDAGGAEGAARAALAVVGDVLVCASSVEAARAGAPYLARTLVPASRGATLRPAPQILGAPFVADVLDGAVSRDVFGWAQRSLDTATAELTGSARRAMSAQALPQTLGDPLATLAAARARLDRLTALLRDVGTVHVTLAPGGGGLRLSLRAGVRAGTPLDQALTALPQHDARTLARLPRGTALAASFGADPAATRGEWSFGEGLADDLTRGAGARLSPADATKLRAALAQLGAARGSSLIAALGHDRSAPFAVLASADGGAASTTESLAAALDGALDTSYSRGVLGLALSCDGDAAPRPATALVDLAGTTLRVRDLCGAHASAGTPDAPARRPRIDLANRDHAWALAVTQQPGGAVAAPLSSVAARVAGAFAGVEDGATLAADPDAARAFEALPARAHFVLAVVPDQLLGAATLFTTALSPAAANTPAANTPAANTPPAAQPGPPLLLALSSERGALQLDLILPTLALAHSAQTAAAAASLAP